jgi:predicted Fe-S protein YdhL (DUF1289 family)
MAHTATAIESPCRSICIVHPMHELCMGCGRSLDEIAGWIDFDDAERRRIMAQLPARLRMLPSADGPVTKA